MVPFPWPDGAAADAAPAVFWLDGPARPEPLASLRGPESADLLVVGGGYTGLWAALRAKDRDPSRDVVLVEAGHCGDQASGRNGGFAPAPPAPRIAPRREQRPAQPTEPHRPSAADHPATSPL